MSPNNRKQALVIEGSDVLANHFGMAPGMLAEHGSRLYMLLPGPPSELRPMFENEAKPLLLKSSVLMRKLFQPCCVFRNR